MLDLLRRKAQSPYLQVTVVAIILVFIFWGVGNNRGNGPNVVATVNDTPIGYQEYQKTYNQILDTFRQQFGGSIPKGLLDSLNIKEQALNKLIERVLIQQEAAEIGIAVSDSEVRQAIEKISSFQRNGVFDVNNYRQILAASRLTVKDFEAGVRSDLLTQKVVDALTRFGRVATDDLQDRFNFDNAKVHLTYAKFTADAYRDQVESDGQGLAAFFDSHKSDYQTAEQRKLSYITFLTKDVGEVAIGDEELKAEYQRNLERFTIPEQRQARHILFKVSPEDSEETKAAKLQQAEEVLAKVRAGEDFAGLATIYSEDSSAAQGGDLGLFGRGKMVKPFEDAVFGMAEGDVSEIVESRFGYHIIKLEKIVPARLRSLAEVSAGLKTQLQFTKARQQIRDIANAAYRDIIMAGSLAKYAKQSGREVVETGFFSRRQAPDGPVSNAAFLDAAFSLKQGELSSLVELSDGYAVIFVNEIQEPQIPELDQVRDKVEQDYLAQKARELAQEKATAMLAAVRDGQDFAAACKAFGVTPETAPPYSRVEKFSAALPGELLDKGLSLTETAPYPQQIVTDGDASYVFRFNSLELPAAELFAEKKEQYEKRLKDESTNAMLTAWLAGLKAKAEITTNQALL